MLPSYLFVLPWSITFNGGVNQVVINLAKNLQNSGRFEPIVLMADWDAIEPIWETIFGIKTVRWRIRSFRENMSIKESVSYHLWERNFHISFRKFCEEFQIAVINPHFPGPIAMTIDRLRRKKIKQKIPIPLVLSFHGSDILSITQCSKRALIQWKKLLEHIDGVIVCSHDLENRLTKIFGKIKNICVIHNGLDADMFILKAKNNKKITDRKFILNVGKFEEQKGQDVLISAFAEMALTYPDLDLILVGAEGSALSTLRELCIFKEIQQRVKFIINVQHDDIANFFSRATIFTLPSRQEAFGIVLLEAGAFSLPTVASNVGGIPEILIEGVTGYMVPPNDPIALSESLKKLLDSPLTAQTMGRHFHEHILQNFTWTAACKKYITFVSQKNPNL